MEQRCLKVRGRQFALVNVDAHTFLDGPHPPAAGEHCLLDASGLYTVKTPAQFLRLDIPLFSVKGHQFCTAVLKTTAAVNHQSVIHLVRLENLHKILVNKRDGDQHFWLKNPFSSITELVRIAAAEDPAPAAPQVSLVCIYPELMLRARPVLGRLGTRTVVKKFKKNITATVPPPPHPPACRPLKQPRPCCSWHPPFQVFQLRGS